VQYPPQAAIDAAVETITDAGFPAVYKPTDCPDAEDDEIEVTVPGKPWIVSIQIGPGYICLNRYTANPFSMQDIGREYPNLIVATEAVLEYVRAA
jgi:hypothetical protein